mmetsp:Transcript_12140/g.34750  ORF Transcript_12140/g.34750 Transcript_12140/m.34750 type:complete len:318 (+) Transcript_12140:428-1381(+)
MPSWSVLWKVSYPRLSLPRALARVENARPGQPVRRMPPTPMPTSRLPTRAVSSRPCAQCLVPLDIGLARSRLTASSLSSFDSASPTMPSPVTRSMTTMRTWTMPMRGRKMRPPSPSPTSFVKAASRASNPSSFVVPRRLSRTSSKSFTRPCRTCVTTRTTATVMKTTMKMEMMVASRRKKTSTRMMTSTLMRTTCPTTTMIAGRFDAVPSAPLPPLSSLPSTIRPNFGSMNLPGGRTRARPLPSPVPSSTEPRSVRKTAASISLTVSLAFFQSRSRPPRMGLSSFPPPMRWTHPRVLSSLTCVPSILLRSSRRAKSS